MKTKCTRHGGIKQAWLRAAGRFLRWAVRGFWCPPWTLVAAIALLGGLVCPPMSAASDRSQIAAGDDSRVNAVEAVRLLVRLDSLLDNLQAGIKNIRAQAERMLDRADNAPDGKGQMRFEEMYGKLVMAAEKLEQERDRLRLIRDEFAAAGGGQ